MADGHELIGSEGCGSMVVEMAFQVAGVPVTLTDLPYLEPGPGRDRLLALNPPRPGADPDPARRNGDHRERRDDPARRRSRAGGRSGSASRRSPPAGRPQSDRHAGGGRLPDLHLRRQTETFVGEGPQAALMKERIDARRLAIWRQLEARVSHTNAFLVGDEPDRGRPTYTSRRWCSGARTRLVPDRDAAPFGDRGPNRGASAGPARHGPPPHGRSSHLASVEPRGAIGLGSRRSRNLLDARPQTWTRRGKRTSRPHPSGFAPWPASPLPA